MTKNLLTGILSSNANKILQETIIIAACLLFAGIDVTLKVVCNCSRMSQLYQKATKLLRIFIGSAILGEKRNIPSPNKKDDRNPNSIQNRYII